MKNSFLTLFLTIILFSSCQKELTFDTPLGTTGPATSCASGTYMPLTVGNTWTYITDSSSQTMLVLPGDTVINGKTFKRLSQTGTGTQALQSYTREENGNIYEYVNLAAAGVATGYVNRNPLRASAAVGDQWSDTSIVNGITEIFKYEIKAKNISVPVDAKTFTNVIHVHIKVYLDLPLLGNSLVQTTDIYYAMN